MPRDDYRRGSSRDDDRGSRDRDDDRSTRRSSRDEAPRERERETRDTRSSRDDDRGSSRGRDRDEPRSRDRDSGRDRDESRGGRSSYVYQRRDDADVARRATANSKFDKYLNGDIKIYKPRDGSNHLRILPPTWAGAKHYGFDMWVHYGVGADRQTYLCLQRMKDAAQDYFDKNKILDKNGDPAVADGRDPVEEEAVELRRDGYEKEAKEASHSPRVGVFVIDRKAESEGVQFWLMGPTADREIVQHSINKRTGAVLAIDDPEDGYDIFFDKAGKDLNTKYTGWDVDRDPSPLGNDRWLQWAVDHPIPDQLIFYPYDHIANMLGGGGGHSNKREDDSRGGRDSGRDSGRDRDEPRSRDSGRDREEPRSRDREEPRGRSRDADEPTWDSIHEMRPRELEDLIDERKLDIDPKEAKDDEDLADWVCEEMGIKKAEPARRSVTEDKGDERGDKLRRMREERDR